MNVVALKLDMSKANDRVNWQYLKCLLCKCRFPPRFTDLIMRCISITSIVISFNGFINESFHPSRDLRQGDPLSLLLFMLYMSALSAMISRSVVQGLWQGITYCQSGQPITCILYADNVIIFGHANLPNITSMLYVIQQFCSNRVNKSILRNSKLAGWAVFSFQSEV